MKSSSGTPVIILAGAPTSCITSMPVPTTWTLLTVYCPSSSGSDELAIETVGVLSPNTVTVQVWDPCATYNNGQCVSPTGTPLVTAAAVLDYTQYTTVNLGFIFGNPFTGTPSLISGQQGTDSLIQTAGSVSGTGATLCTDSSGGTTTVGCTNSISAKLDLSAQAANVNTTLYAVPSGGAGTYTVSCYPVLTRAATTSSTLPSCIVVWTDKDTGLAESISVAGPASTANTVGTIGITGGTGLAGTVNVQAAASTNISIVTSGYATSGATSMQFALHAKAVYVGP